MPMYIKHSERSPNLNCNSNRASLLLGYWFELQQLKDGKWQSIDDPYIIDSDTQYRCHPITECPFTSNKDSIKDNQWYGVDIIPNGIGFFASKQMNPQGPLEIDLPKLREELSLGPMV